MNEKALRRIEECKRTKDTILNLAKLDLKEIPPQVRGLIWLKVLYLQSNKISKIEGLGKLNSLKKLFLHYNQISKIEGLEKLNSLDTLYLDTNQISKIEGLEKLNSLKELYLSGNQISKIEGLGKLNSLKELYLHYNQISKIEGLGKLNSLKKLYLRYNQISKIEGLEKLNSLDTLYLDTNQISKIEGLGKLKQLKFLDLQKNNIKDVSNAKVYFKASDLELAWKEGFYSFDGDKGINLYDNPIENPPLEIIKQGKQAVLNWFENIEKGKQPFNEGKVILIGEGASGKSSLVDRIVNDNYVDNRNTTHGVNLVKWQLPNHKNIKVNFWDFGGQQIQRAVHKFFLTTACLYIVVCDNRKEDKPQFWLEHIKTLAKGANVIVVYNKADQGNKLQFSNGFLKEKYPNIVGFYQLSCKACDNNATYRKQMDRFIEDLENYIVNLESVTKDYPSNYLNIKQKLEEETKLGKNYISLKKYHSICNANDLPSVTGKKELLGVLGTLGTITYFEDLPIPNLQVLNPEWLTSGVYRILTHKEITQKKKGKITVDDFDEILKIKEDFDLVFDKEDHYYYLVVLMKRFGICYTKDDKHLLIPGQFSEQMPSTYSDFKEEESYRLYFVDYKEFLPKPIITQFIANHIDKAVDEKFWNVGIEIKDTVSNTYALVEEDQIAERINVYLKGENVLGFWQYIFRQICDYSSSYDGIEYEEMVMLKEKNESNKVERAISFQQLMNAISDKEPVFYDSILRMNIDAFEFISYFKDEEQLKEIFSRKVDGSRLEFSPTINVDVKQTTNLNINISIENLTKTQDSFEDILDKLKALKVDDKALLNKGDEVLKELQNFDESNKDEIADKISFKNKLKRFSRKLLEAIKTTKTVVIDTPKVYEFFIEKIGNLLIFAKTLKDQELINNLQLLLELLNGGLIT